MEKQNSYSHILKYTGVFGGVQGLNIAVGLVRNKLAALLLGPSGMGIVAMLSSILKFVGDTTGLGVSTSAMREISAAHKSGSHELLSVRISEFRTWSLIASALGFVVCIAMSPIAVHWSFMAGMNMPDILLLAPIAALTTFASGELAILKATRHLSQVARSSVFTAIMSLVVSVPFYYYLGSNGIVPSLLLIVFMQTLVVTRFSLRFHRFRIRFSPSSLRGGYGMVRLGMAFVAAGIMGSGSEMCIRAYIEHAGGTSAVGLYNAAYVIVFTYAATVFASMDSDYYPRLSSLPSLGDEFNSVVNTQIEVSLHLIAPLLILLIWCVPLILPLMFSGKFAMAAPMVQAAAMAMYARAIYLPVEYIALARGGSVLYFLMETIAAILLVSCTITGFCHYGLTGAGLGMSIAAFAECVVVCVLYNICYGYTMTSQLGKVIALHTTIGVCAYTATVMHSNWWYTPTMLSLLCIELANATCMLQKSTNLVGKIKKRIKKLRKVLQE